MIDCQSEGIPAPTHQWKKQLKKMMSDVLESSNSLLLDGIKFLVPDESDTNDIQQHSQQQNGNLEQILDTSSSSSSGTSSSSGSSGSSSLSASDYLVPIVSGPHIHVLENGSLAIIDANKSDQGEFVCEA